MPMLIRVTLMTGRFYYSVLLWAAILYGAGVVFKFGSLYLYEALMPWFSETPVKRITPPAMPTGKALLWRGLGIYVLLCGLVQIPPQVALDTKSQLQHLDIASAQWALSHPLMQGWIQAWSIHPITYNILSFMLQAVIGIFLLTEPNTLTGRITLGFTLAWALLIGIFAQGLGFILSSKNSLVAGAPGSGFLVAAASVLLLMPDQVWRAPRLDRWISRGWLAVFAIGTIWQCAYFQAPRLAASYPLGRALPQPTLLRAAIHDVSRFSAHDAVLVNLIWLVSLAVLAYAGITISQAMKWVATILLLVVWWIGQDFGLTAQFGLNLNTAPLWALLLWARRSSH